MYYFAKTDKKFNNWLPSLNLRYELSKDMIARFGASRTIGRQNYNILGAGLGTPTCDASGCHVTGPNPDLKPLTSDNLDAVVGLVLRAPFDGGRGPVLLEDRRLREDRHHRRRHHRPVRCGDQAVKTYAVNTSSQQGAKHRRHRTGVRAAVREHRLRLHQSNVSRAKTKVDDGRPMVGASEWAGNLGGYYENDKRVARLVANYRGEYVNSSTAPAPTANSQGLSS
jgi:iron complex outermembrane receptor protein